MYSTTLIPISLSFFNTGVEGLLKNIESFFCNELRRSAPFIFDDDNDDAEEDSFAVEEEDGAFLKDIYKCTI